MLDGVSLDQLRTFIAAAETGSFSAAGRRLGRAQSVVSQTLANFEGQIGVRLFDRAGRLPKLTNSGRVLLAEARAVAGGMDRFKAQARGLAGGLEPELSVAVDVMFPMRTLTCAVAAFREAFPFTPLRLFVETLGCGDRAGAGRTMRFCDHGDAAAASRGLRTRAGVRHPARHGRGAEPPARDSRAAHPDIRAGRSHSACAD